MASLTGLMRKASLQESFFVQPFFPPLFFFLIVLSIANHLCTHLFLFCFVCLCDWFTWSSVLKSRMSRQASCSLQRCSSVFGWTTLGSVSSSSSSGFNGSAHTTDKEIQVKNTVFYYSFWVSIKPLQYGAKVWTPSPFIYILLGKWEIHAVIYWNKQTYMEIFFNTAWTLLCNLSCIFFFFFFSSSLQG